MKRICISAVLALFCASLLPSCGGGGDSKGDFYMSTNNFKTGSKKFYIMSSPSLEVVGGGTFEQGGSTKLSKEEVERLFGKDYVEDGGIGGGTVAYCQGRMNAKGNTAATCDYAYFVSGNKGRLIAYPQNKYDYDALVHFVGAITPEDIKFSGFKDSGANNDNVDMPDIKQVLVISSEGTYFDFEFDMSTGTVKVQLCYSSASLVDEETEGGLFSSEYNGVIQSVRPFMVQPN